MRSFINVIAKNELVRVLANVVVVAKRNAEKLSHTLRHLSTRRLHAGIGYLPSFMYGQMQPVPAAAPITRAATAAGWRERDCRVSRRRTRLG
jgi:hypothetical protein